MKKHEVVKAMKAAGLLGTVTGKGERWEVELPDVASMREFTSKVVKVGGFKTGYGSYMLRPGYLALGDWNDSSSRNHY